MSSKGSMNVSFCSNRPVKKPRSPTKIGTTPIPSPNVPSSTMPPIATSSQSRKPTIHNRSSPPARHIPSPPTSMSNKPVSPEQERNNNNDSRFQIRPGTYKKSESTPCDQLEDDPSRRAIIAMVEKDVAFSDVENRRLLMAFIKKICQAHC